MSNIFHLWASGKQTDIKKKPSVKPPYTINPEAQRMFNYLPTTCSVKAMFFSINSETLFHKQFMKTQLELRLLKLVYKQQKFTLTARSFKTKLLKC